MVFLTKLTTFQHDYRMQIIMKFAKLPISRWQDYKKFYVESVTDSPQAFLWSKEEISSKEDSEWQDRIKNMFFAIADDEQLVGMAGFYCDEKKKLAHIANIVRVYVNPEYRGKGIGKKILLTVVEDIKSRPEIKKYNWELSQLKFQHSIYMNQ